MDNHLNATGIYSDQWFCESVMGLIGPNVQARFLCRSSLTALNFILIEIGFAV